MVDFSQALVWLKHGWPRLPRAVQRVLRTKHVIPSQRRPGPSIAEWAPCDHPDCEDPGNQDWTDRVCPACN